MSFKRNGSPLAKMRLRRKLEQDAVAEALGVGGGKSIWSRFETGRELLPAELVAPLAELYKTTQRRIAWAAAKTFRRGLTITRYKEMMVLGDYDSRSKKVVDTTRRRD